MIKFTEVVSEADSYNPETGTVDASFVEDSVHQPGVYR